MDWMQLLSGAIADAVLFGLTAFATFMANDARTAAVAREDEVASRRVPPSPPMDAINAEHVPHDTPPRGAT